MASLPDGLILGVVLLAVYVLLPIAVCMVMDRIRASRESRLEEAEETLEEWEARLLNPRFAELEAYFGCAVPASLERLYMDHDLLLQRGLTISSRESAKPEDGWDILRFLPADDKTLVETQLDVEPGYFPFAINMLGDHYVIPFADCSDERCPVSLAPLHGGEMEAVAESLDEFLSRPRSVET